MSIATYSSDWVRMTGVCHQVSGKAFKPSDLAGVSSTVTEKQCKAEMLANFSVPLPGRNRVSKQSSRDFQVQSQAHNKDLLEI